MSETDAEFEDRHVPVWEVNLETFFMPLDFELRLVRGDEPPDNLASLSVRPTASLVWDWGRPMMYLNLSTSKSKYADGSKVQ